MYLRACCNLETIFENESDDEISTTIQSQPEINLIATVDSTNSFNKNRSAISSIKQHQKNITPRRSNIHLKATRKTRVIEGRRNAIINPNLSLPIFQKDTNYPDKEFMNRRYAIDCISPTISSTYSNTSNNLVINSLHNFSSPTLSDLYYENDVKKIQSCPSLISFKVHIHWIYPSSPLVIKLSRDISLRKFRKIVAKSCGIKVPKDSVIIWHRNLNCDGISVGEENNDKVILKHLLKSGKVSGIKTDARWKCLKSFWCNDVEVSVVKKELLE
ncbi:1779_t:CDS:1 [Dentiscutata erythropus]|uniref:1779_t:CDS:1 n=1 Tax=Dentiscutata erythropus TaxID=1348616 RepID=A0A9N9DGN5_9GLOM|nr:1779_t:CDS:1 [Dentiscutata erythropus]